MANRLSKIRQRYINRINSGEVLLCGICNYPVVAKAKGKDRIIDGGLGAVTVDHIIPKARGGTNRIENLQPAHLKCNYEKADTMPCSTSQQKGEQ